MTGPKLENYRVFILDEKGDIYFNLGDYKNSLSSYTNAYQTAVENHDFIGSARALQRKGIFYGKRNDLDSCEYYIEKSIEIVEKNIYAPIGDSTKNKNLLLNLKSNLALMSMKQSKWTNSITYCYESLDLAQKLNNKNTTCLIYGYIAANFKNLKEYDKSLGYFRKEFSLAKEIKNMGLIGYSYLHIASIWEAKKQYNDAENNILHGLEVFRSDNNRDGIMLAKCNLFTLYRLSENFKKAHGMEKEVLELVKTSGGELAHLYTELGDINTSEGNYQEARKFFDLAEQTYDSKNESKSFLYEKRAILMQKMGEYKEAFELKEKQLGLTKKEMSDVYVNKFAELEAKFQAAEKEARIKMQQLQLANQKSKLTTVLSGAAFLLLFSVGGFFWQKSKQKQKMFRTKNLLLTLQQNINQMELQNLNQQLDPHEIKNLLSSISPEIQIKAPEAYKQMLKLLNLTKVSLNSKSITDSIENQVLQIEDYLSLEKNMLSVPLSYSIYNSVKNTQIQIPRLLLKNLVENSVKHGIKGKQNGGAISISILEEPTQLHIEVDDTGMGRKREIPLDSGIGISTYQKLFATLNQSNIANASLLIIDKEMGTKVEVRIPLEYKYSS